MGLPPDILEFYDTEIRRGKSILASNYRIVSDENAQRAIGPVPSADHNWIDFVNWNAAPVSEVIEAQIEWYQTVGHSLRWKIHSHDAPPGIGDRLLTRGFKPDEECTVMILDVSRFQSSVPEGIEYLLLTNPDRLDEELRPVATLVWTEDVDDLMTAFACEMRDIDDHLSFYAAKREGETVGCGLVRYNERMTFGGLFAGSTVPAERGKGIYRGIVSVRVVDAQNRGVNYLYTEAGPMSRPILERLGFEPVSELINYVFEVV